jgi:hypothetical protein
MNSICPPLFSLSLTIPAIIAEQALALFRTSRNIVSKMAEQRTNAIAILIRERFRTNDQKFIVPMNLIRKSLNPSLCTTERRNGKKLHHCA